MVKPGAREGGQLSMRSFFAGVPKPEPQCLQPETAAPKRPREPEGPVRKRLAKSCNNSTPTQRHATPIARTETSSKHPSSASESAEPSSGKASAVRAAIRDSLELRPSPLSSNTCSTPSSVGRPQGNKSVLSASSPASQPSSQAAEAAAAAAAAAASTENRELSYSFLRNKRDAKGKRENEPGYDKSTLMVQLKGSERFTPGQQQYWDIKKNYNDVVIFFKMGKFYELFEEDALIGHRELDLAFMGKDAPHVGFPEAALGKYAEKLVSVGYKVGVVEQMETPQQLEERNKLAGKGMKDKTVRRELCSVLTKGVAFHREDVATYLLAVYEDEASGRLGICFVDAASGKFALGQCMEDAAKNRLHTLLAQLRPTEIVVDEACISRTAFTMLRRSVPDGLFNKLAHRLGVRRTHAPGKRAGE